jgi:ribosomal-protein-alanine N-acetyltransferase
MDDMPGPGEPILPPDPPLADGGIVLRLLEPSDATAILAAVQDPEIPRFTAIPPTHTLPSVASWIASRPDAMAAGEGIDFAIADGVDGQLVGSIGVGRSADDPRCAEVGYWVAAPARGRGVATAALRLVTAWALSELELARIQLTTHEENAPSQHVAEAAGFRREGLLRALREQHGRRVDLVMYARLPGDELEREATGV